MVAFRKVAFSSRKAALAAKKEANCCCGIPAGLSTFVLVPVIVVPT